MEIVVFRTPTEGIPFNGVTLLFVPTNHLKYFEEDITHTHDIYIYIYIYIPLSMCQGYGFVLDEIMPETSWRKVLGIWVINMIL